MMDSHSVISEVTAGHVKELASEYDVTISRMYEMLGEQCNYPKTKKLIRKIAKVNPEGVWLIKADIDAMFLDLLESAGEVSVAELHKESTEAVQAELEGKSPSDRARELREAIATMQRQLIHVETLGFSPAEKVAQFKQRKVAR